jgi:uncharacterized SAM-binding protein YcdF (DUF218 family)
MHSPWVHLWLPLLVLSTFAVAALVALFFRKRMLAGCLFGFGLLLFIAFIAPSIRPARPTAQKNACIANLKQLDGAKAQWASEKKPEASIVAQPSDLAPFLKGGLMPFCPLGGT